jgi:LuxR family maltose regulon positive regulatory protein
LIVRLLFGLSNLYYLSGDLHKQGQVAQQLLNRCPKNQLLLSASWAHLFVGVMCYHHDSLTEAATNFLAVTERRYLANTRTSHECMLNLALTYQAQGRYKAARQVAQDALEFALELHHPTLLAEAGSFRARLALLQGDLGAALSWARGVNTENLPARTLFTEIPRLTLAKVLIEEGSRDNIQTASQILDDILAAAKSVHCTRYVIECLAVQALAHHSQGESQKAMSLLLQSLKLAEPGSFVRLYVELGPAMAHLLNQVAELAGDAGYVGRILGAFPLSFGVQQGRQRSEPIPHPELLEPLTVREQEILELLARRMTSKEIAQLLFISPHTVNKHASNVYSKLQVSGRRQAVDTARALGILPSE